MLTTIIPVYKLSDDRKRNLEFLYARLKEQLPDSRVIISIQSSDDDGDYYEKFDEVVYFKNNNNTFNKSALINYSLDNIEISSSFVMLLDGDIYFKFKNLEDQTSLLSDEKVIKPFSECVYLTESHTLEFIDKRKITLSGGLKKISALGGGAIILKSSLIKDSSVRYDENFSGWGWEDIDFGDNIRSKFSIKTLQQPAIHLYHPVVAESSSNNYIYYKNKNKPKNKIVHTVSHACVDKEHRLHAAQTNALQSLFVAKKNLDVLLLNACSEFCINNDNIKTIQLSRTAKDIGYNRDLPYLDDVINFAIPYVEDNGWIVYTNSDCVVKDKFYEDILKYNYDYIEFKRQDVDDKGNHIRSISRGIDGFAIRKKLLEKTPMPKLIVGAPYWDDVVSKIYSKTADKFMTVNNELIHVDHEATYDLNNLDIAGEFNYKQLVLSNPSIQIEKDNILARDKIISEYIDSQIKNPKKSITSVAKSTKKRKNILVLSMCLNQEKKSDLYNRELLFLESLRDVNACEIFNNIILIVNDLNDKHRFLMQKYLPYAKLIKAKEQFTSFKELFDVVSDFSLNKDDVWLTYINSDCCVKTLSFLNSSPSILYRYEVDCSGPKKLTDVYSASKSPCLTGIDGFYCPVSFFEKLAKDNNTNFYFGNPAWDVVLGIRMLNELEDTTRVRDELYHLKHDPVWKSTLGGSAVYPKNNKFITKNNKLYLKELDYLANTNLNKKVSCINISENEPINRPSNKIRIIIPFHKSSLSKDDPLRVFALENCLLAILRQGYIDYSEIIVVEAVLKDELSTVQPIVDKINKYNNIHVITIRSDLNDCKPYYFIYQKEILLNIGAEQDGLNGNDILIFLDSDILIKDPSWLKTIHKKFNDSNDEMLLYPWRKSYYLDVFFREIYSVCNPADSYSNGDKQDLYSYFNPGMCVSLRKKDFKGMSEWFYLGGGDTAFLYTHGQQSDMIPSIMTINHYSKELLSIKSKRQKYSVEQIPIDIYHMWHGELVDYSNKFGLMSNFSSDIKDVLEKEPSGLIRWKKILCEEFNILSKQLNPT